MLRIIEDYSLIIIEYFHSITELDCIIYNYIKHLIEYLK